MTAARPRPSCTDGLVASQPRSTGPIGATPPRTDVRTLFLSDVHLGSKHSRAGDLADLLGTVTCEAIYLVGDIVDGWRLAGRWYWQPAFSRFLAQLLRHQANGAKLYYTPGNHDEFLRPFVQDFGVVEMADEFIHVAADGRRFLVTHGDQFDGIERGHGWLSRIGSRAYESLLTLNTWHDRVRQHAGLPGARLSARIKHRVKSAVVFTRQFEQAVTAAANAAACQGVICGHIHTPRIARIEATHYLNTGDWVESQTGLIEHHDGSWTLFGLDGGTVTTMATLAAEDRIATDGRTPALVTGPASATG